MGLRVNTEEQLGLFVFCRSSERASSLFRVAKNGQLREISFSDWQTFNGLDGRACSVLQITIGSIAYAYFTSDTFIYAIKFVKALRG